MEAKLIPDPADTIRNEKIIECASSIAERAVGLHIQGNRMRVRGIIAGLTGSKLLAVLHNMPVNYREQIVELYYDPRA